MEVTALSIATEDPLSEAVAERLLRDAIPSVQIVNRLGGTGFGYLRKTLPKFIQMARTCPVFLLTDLDRIDCPPTLVETWRQGRSLPDGLLFRVAVRETEAWLMADHDGFSDFTGIPKSKLPQDVEGVLDPKETLLGLVRKHARKDVRTDLLPDASAKTARVSLTYNARLSAFVRDPNGWNPARAAENADSLRRARMRLAGLH